MCLVVTPSGVGGNCAIAYDASARLLAHNRRSIMLTVELYQDWLFVLSMEM